MTYVTHYCEWKNKDGVVCNQPLTEKAYNFSTAKYGLAFCFGHQQQFKVEEKEPITYASPKEYQEIMGEI